MHHRDRGDDALQHLLLALRQPGADQRKAIPPARQSATATPTPSHMCRSARAAIRCA